MAAATGAQDFKSTPIEAALLRNPDPRGPCGARISIPDPSGGAAQRVQGAGADDLRDHASTPDGQHWIDQVRRRQHAGCGAYDSQVALRGPQTVTPLGRIALPAVGDDRIAYAARVTTSDGGCVGTFLLVRHGGLVTALTMFSKKPVPEATVAGLAQATDDALSRSKGS